MTETAHIIIREPEGTVGIHGMDYEQQAILGFLARYTGATGARAMDPEWVRTLRNECWSTSTAFFFKQWGSHDEHGKRMSKHAAGRLLDGKTWDEYPATAVAS